MVSIIAIGACTAHTGSAALVTGVILRLGIDMTFASNIRNPGNFIRLPEYGRNIFAVDTFVRIQQVGKLSLNFIGSERCRFYSAVNVTGAAVAVTCRIGGVCQVIVMIAEIAIICCIYRIIAANGLGFGTTFAGNLTQIEAVDDPGSVCAVLRPVGNTTGPAQSVNITSIVTTYEGTSALRSANQAAIASIIKAQQIPVGDICTIPYMLEGGIVCTASDCAHTDYINKGGSWGCGGVFIFAGGNVTPYQTVFNTKITDSGINCSHEEAGSHATGVIDKQIGYRMQVSIKCTLERNINRADHTKNLVLHVDIAHHVEGQPFTGVGFTEFRPCFQVIDIADGPMSYAVSIRCGVIFLEIRIVMPVLCPVSSVGLGNYFRDASVNHS